MHGRDNVLEDGMDYGMDYGMEQWEATIIALNLLLALRMKCLDQLNQPIGIQLWLVEGQFGVSMISSSNEWACRIIIVIMTLMLSGYLELWWKVLC